MPDSGDSANVFKMSQDYPPFKRRPAWDVDRIIRKGNILNFTLQKMDICEAAFPLIFLCMLLASDALSKFDGSAPTQQQPSAPPHQPPVAEAHPNDPDPSGRAGA